MITKEVIQKVGMTEEELDAEKAKLRLEFEEASKKDEKVKNTRTPS